jgi:hypothetical protein
MLVVGAGCSCRSLFKKLNVLTLPSLWLFSLVMFVYNNPDNFNTNLLIHKFDTRNKTQLRHPLMTLTSNQQGVTYFAINIFNALPSNTLQLQSNNVLFKSELRKCLVANAFYSIEEFLSNTRNAE